MVGGPPGGFLGLSLALAVGLIALYTDDRGERIDELEAEVEALRRELEAVGDGGPTDDG